MKNKEVAALLYEIADILEIQNVKFKPVVYRRAAQNIDSTGEPIEEVHRKGRLRDIDGVGEAIAGKIAEFLDTEEVRYLQKLKEEVPPGLLDMLGIPGLGPKKVSLINRELGIESIEELKEACRNHNLEGIKGLGAKTEENILRGIELLESSKGRYLLDQALRNGKALKEHLSELPSVKKIELAGSLRRRKETVGDIDILVSSDDPEEVMDAFVAYEGVSDVMAKGATKSSIRLKDDMQADLRVVPQESFGAAMQYFTGSKEHNVKVRKIAISKALKINEYGVFRKDTEDMIAGDDEKKVYNALGLEYIEPELRENRGEVELAASKDLPELVTQSDIKGDLHVHSEWSDGFESIESMVMAAKDLGYSYMAVCDHSGSLKIAGGLSKDRLRDQIREIKKINDRTPDFKVFSSLECNINTDGSLDIQSDILEDVDFITAAVHSSFSMGEKEMTERMIKALENHKVRVLAHPTGRLLGKREPYKVNLDELADAALDNNVFFEINSFPDRLDLSDANILYVRKKDMRFVISTDSHRSEHLDYLQYGVSTARRGWLEKGHVINTLSLNKIEKLLMQ